MKTNLAGKVVLVTGGASGIGRSSCLAFAAEGAKVVVADVDAQGGEEAARMIRQTGGEAAFVRCDVSNVAEVEALVKRTVELHGGLDCAHNNAGITGPRARTIDCGDHDWDAVLNVNLKGVWLCMKGEIALMLKQKRGAIVNTASTGGVRGMRVAGIYCVASHGIVGLTQSAALEHAGEGIRINAVCPGVVDTPMIRALIAGDAQKEAQFKASCPMGRMAAPEELAQPAVWLCSDAASYVTGHIMIVDGGRTAQ